MNIVITMAGSGTRFLRAGYNQPKYTIKAKGKTLFEWSLLSLTGYNSLPDLNYIFIVQAKDSAVSFITEKINQFKIKQYQIIEVDQPTDGQATSALLAEKHWHPDQELIIYNIDTYIEPNTLKYSDVQGDGFIPCFKAPGNHWSFVKLDDNGKVTEIKEKQRISDNCTIGLYYFKSCQLYQSLYREYYGTNNLHGQKEKFIAPLYNLMVAKNLDVRINLIPSKKVHVLGTPEELNAFINAQ